MGDSDRPARVFTIPPGTPFLATLVDALLSGRLVPGFSLDRDPAALADVTIYLPTRRAARTLRASFVAALGGRAAILPRIQPIGDVDEDLFALDDFSLPDGDLPPAIPPLERRLAITRLVLEWAEAVARATLRLAPDEPVLVPASPADAAGLADDLIRLMDQVAAEGADWAKLKDLVPDAYAGYWQISLAFLKIVTDIWPAFLAERDALDPTVRRDLLIAREAERLRTQPPRGPVIAAGSTGSMPATATLLATVARLDQGALILPGLDQALDVAGWTAIGAGKEPTAVASHPQFGLKNLLSVVGIGRDDVVALGEPTTPALVVRNRLVGEALKPAEATDAWARALPQETASEAGVDEAFAAVSLIEAANEEEEALAIALSLREALHAGKKAALVTPDRPLARRVAVHLRRWDIGIDDSAGRPLADTPPAVLARLVAEVALAGFDPVSLLALLKHPLARLGLPVPEVRRAARLLEILVLRGPRPATGSAGLKAALAAADAALLDDDSHTPRVRRRLSEIDRKAAADLVDRLTAALHPLEAIANGPSRTVTPAELVEAHIAALHAIADEGEATTPPALYAEPAGEALAAFLRQLTEARPDAFAILPGEWPGLFHALLSGIAVRPTRPGDERLHIWGPLEARLQPVDRMILGGLVEGVWPATTRSDPWLSRPMRASLGLDSPERRIGLAAHDFAQGMGSAEVMLTRTLRAGGAPTVASRWLQRLKARLGKDAIAPMTARGERILALCRLIDGPADHPRPAERPNPKPPLDARPKGLSVTRIETLIRDPYAIYAQYVLGLDEIDPIAAAPDMATRGTLLHDILGTFTGRWSGPFDARALDALIEEGRAAFRPLRAFPDLHALWWPRFVRIAARFIDWEAGERAGVAARHAEVKGRLDLALPGAGFRLTGRADRIDVLADGSLSIVDFKTGAPPSKSQVETLLAPQLPLEAAMATAGAFDGIDAGKPVGELLYVELKDDPSVVFSKPRGDETGPAALAEAALASLTGLVATYGDPDRGYLSRAQPDWERRFASPYDHLARVREWSLGGGEDD